VTIFSNCEELYLRLNKDFSYYISADDKSEFLTIEVNQVTPDFSILKKLKKWRQTDFVTTYDKGQVRFNNYNDKALSKIDYRTNKAEIFGEDLEILHELSYLMTLSLIGKKMDLMGIHRVHAMGINLGGVSSICMLPMGGGKSTLLAHLLKYDDIQLLSDDVPLVQLNGEIREFPIRLGVDPIIIEHIIDPQDNIYSLERREYGKKELISLNGIKNAIYTGKPIKQLVFQGKRVSGKESRIRTANFFEKVNSLFVNLIIGIGLPMIFEYFWRGGVTDFFVKTRIAISRMLCSFNLCRRSEFYIFEMGEDPSFNAELFYNFIKERQNEK
jgi:hypothetical protein